MSKSGNDRIDSQRQVREDPMSRFVSKESKRRQEKYEWVEQLKVLMEQIRQEELARFTKQLDAVEMEKVDKITKSMMQKIIKLPVLQLKAACKRGEAETLVDILNDLFDLEKTKVVS